MLNLNRLRYFQIIVLALGFSLIPFLPSHLSAHAQGSSATVTAIVQYNNLNVRVRPHGQVLGQLQMGDVVEVTGREERVHASRNRLGVVVEYWGWIQIHASANDTSGWISARHVYFSRGDWLSLVPVVEPPPDLPRQRIAITARVGFNRVNVRASPQTDSPVLGQLGVGDVVAVDAFTYSGGLWLHVFHAPSGLEGWIGGWYARLSTRLWRENLHWVSTGSQASDVCEATVLASGLYVRQEPDPDAPALGQLPWSSRVTVIGTAVLGVDYSSYVYVTALETDLSGWVDVFHLQRTGTCGPSWYRIWRAVLPVVYTDQPEPIPVQGQVIAYVNITGGLRLRAEPNTDADILDDLTVRTLLAVHGRTTHQADGWLYVTLIESGQSGWVYDPAAAEPQYVFFPDGYGRERLPILTASASPDIPTALGPSESLPASANQHAQLRLTPFVNDESINLRRSVRAGAAVTVTGRNINGRWLYVTIDDQSGWVQAFTLDVAGDVARLPIVSLYDGSYQNQLVD